MLPLSIQAQYYRPTVKFPITFTVGNNGSPSILHLFAMYFHTHNFYIIIFVTILMWSFVSGSLSLLYKLNNFFFKHSQLITLKLWTYNMKMVSSKLFSFLLLTVYKIMVSCTQSLVIKCYLSSSDKEVLGLIYKT